MGLYLLCLYAYLHYGIPFIILSLKKLILTPLIFSLSFFKHFHNFTRSNFLTFCCQNFPLLRIPTFCSTNSHFHTFFQNFPLLDFPTFTLSPFYTFIFSHFQTFTLSHFHAFTHLHNLTNFLIFSVQ